ncbi:MAG TPA: bifunctional phosphoglucose/phosphomannose isomerase [Candidatus Acidoferrales bacterium]|nr:bifunctional phosphoglucose/phosphomannose isomerase [Candidatus Acidoferrales bacterium]
MTSSVLDDVENIRAVDRSGMIDFCLNSAKIYSEAKVLADEIKVNYLEPENIVISGMGGSGIGGDLLKDWAKKQTSVPIEVNKDYELPEYAGEKTLVFITSYSGDTEETLNAFLDALKRKCMIFCVSSGGALLENAERLGVPYVRVPSGMPPRAALPYMFVPLLIYMERAGLVEGVSKELFEAMPLLKKISQENAPDKPTVENYAKALAMNIGKTSPVIYGFGIYRGVALRFKQQFNENSKIPAKSDVFSELNHNEIVGWERAEELGECFSAIFLRENDEPAAIQSRIEITKELVEQAGVGVIEIEAQGKSGLARMLSTILVGDFTSVYLSVLRGVDPTPVKTVNYLKDTLKQNGFREKVIGELAKL